MTGFPSSTGFPSPPVPGCNYPEVPLPSPLVFNYPEIAFGWPSTGFPSPPVPGCNYPEVPLPSPLVFNYPEIAFGCPSAG
jgi:hypothetical protein